MNGAIPRLAMFIALTTVTAAWAQQTAPTSRPVMRTDFHGQRVRLSMEEFGSRPVMSVKINGQGPFRFIVDTGTPFKAVIDGEFLRTLGLSVPEQVPTLSQITAEKSMRLERIGVGEAEISDAEIVPADFGQFLTGDANMPRGILGLPLFADGLLTFNFSRKEFIFEAGALDAKDENVVASMPDRGSSSGLSIIANVAGKLIRMHVDTGSPAGLTLLSRWASQLPLKEEAQSIGFVTTSGGQVEVRRAILDGVVKIANQEFANPVLEFADLRPMVIYDCGNIGSRLLRDFAMTVDSRHSLVRLVRDEKRVAGAGAASQPIERYRIGAKLRNEDFTLVVESIQPDSPAQKAGLQVDDIIVAVGDQDLRAWGNDLNSMFDTPNPVKLAVYRGSEKLTLIITPELIGKKP